MNFVIIYCHWVFKTFNIIYSLCFNSLSLFDFRRHGNRNYASPFDALKTLRSSQGKMEKSFLSFQSVYPSWEPNAEGKQFLTNLQKFKEKQIRQQALAQYQAMEASGFVASTRGHRDDIFHQLLPSDIHNRAEAISPAVYNLGPLGLLDTDQRSHPYILDWYYVCHPPHLDRTEAPYFNEVFPETSENTGSAAFKASEIEEARGWDSDMVPPPRADRDEWNFNHERVRSHMDASTSSNLFHHAPVEHHDTKGNIIDWWDQAPEHSTGQQGSFLEPPEFGNRYVAGNRSSYHSGDVSDGSVEELERSYNRSSSSWRRPQDLSTTRYMDDSDIEEGLNLPFADLPQKDEDARHGTSDTNDPTPVGLPVRIIPRSSDPV
jgi:autophagy-related protein 9